MHLPAPDQILEPDVVPARRLQLPLRPQQVQLRQPSAIQEVGDITSRHPYPPRNDLHLDPALTATANLSAERAHITLPPPPGPGLPGLIGAEG